MSIIAQAEYELKRANFGDEESAVMKELLEKFLDTWDSGAAVSVAQQVFNRLLAGKPLSPLTGEDDEWVNVSMGSADECFQNRRCSSVFKDKRFFDGKRAYDINRRGREREAITFPYTPEEDRVEMPVYEVKV